VATDDAHNDELTARLLPLLARYDDFLVEGAAVAGELARASSNPMDSRWRRIHTLISELDRLGRRQVGTEDAPREFPAQIGRFQILGEIGQGGFGIVLLAFDPRLNREVALKVPRLGALATSDLRARFLRESQAAAALDHPNLVAVYEVGESGLLSYIVSAYIAGPDLATWLKHRDRPVPVPLAANLIRILAHAVEHAHRRGVLHRDLKPSNILLAPRDDQRQAETDPADGCLRRNGARQGALDLPFVPKITDFGLAKQLADGAGDTQGSVLMGTVNYMSPEQAAGRRDKLGPASDVYSLGTMLYELLIGQPPLVGDSDLETMVRLQQDEPPRPSRIRPGVPRDLETICLKCLSKEPHDRYATAAELADDLERFLLDEPIRALPAPLRARAARWCRRHPLKTVLAAVVVVLAVMGPLVAINQSRLHSRAEAAAEATRHLLYISDMNRAVQDWQEANLESVAALLEHHRPVAGQADYRGFEWYYLWRQWQATRSTPALASGSAILCMAASPTGSDLAVGCADSRIVVWNLATRRIHTQLEGHTSQVVALSWSPDGATLASASWDGTVRLWDIPAGAVKARLNQGGVWPVAFSPDGGTLALRSEGNQIALWDGKSDQPRLLGDHGDTIRHLTFSPNGDKLASAGFDRTIKLWDLASRQVEATLRGHTSRVWSLAWSPDGKTLASGDVANTIILWDMATHVRRATLGGHRATIWSLAFSPDGDSLASSSQDNMVKLWHARTGEELATLSGHTGEVTAVLYSADGRSLYSAGADGVVRIWDLEAEHAHDVLRPGIAVASVAFSPDGSRVATGMRDGRVVIWDAQTNGRTATEVTTGVEVRRVRYLSAKGRPLIAASGVDGSVALWDVRSAKMIHRFEGGLAESLTPIAADSRVPRLAWFDSDDRLIRVWDVVRERESASLTAYAVWDLQFSADGRLLAAACHDGTVQVFDSHRGELRRTIAAHDPIACAVAFSPDGKRLVSAGDDRTVKLWELDQAEGSPPRRVFVGHGGRVCAVAWSPDGQTLASAGDDRTVRIWDLGTGRQRAALKGHGDIIEDLAFSPDGRILASASPDNTVRLWRAATPEEAAPSRLRPATRP
jgi:WD40 repeat protein